MPIIPTPPIQGSPPPISSAFLRDFTGGLNLAADDVQLPKNEFADALDIDPDVKGGFARRPSFRGLLTSGLDSTVLPQFLFHIVDPTTNGDLVVGGQGSSVDKLATYRTTDIADGHARSNLLTFGVTSAAPLSNWSGALMNKVADTDDLNLYIHRGRDTTVQTYQTDGNLHTALTDAYGNYHDRFVADPTPTGGTNPRASLVCAHSLYLFHADTYENSHRHANRIRWSWEGQPGDYDSTDYIDVGEGQDNDVITAMVSWQGILFIFKELSTWALTGYGADTFALVKIGTGVGATNKNAACAGVDGVYFFDATMGVQRISGTAANGFKIEDLWSKLSRAIDDGRITNVNLACMAAAGSRIAVSGLKWQGASLANRTFIMDSNVGDGWWAYSVGFSLLCCYTTSAGLKTFVGASPYTNYGGASTTYRDFIAIQKVLSTDVDDRFNGSTEVTYNGYMFTSWVDAGDPARKKRFRRFSLTFDAMATNKSFSVNGYRNWSVDIPPVRTFTVAGLGTATAGIAGQQNNVRGGALGTAYSAALLITGPNDVAWGINQVTFRFVPKRVT